MSCKCSNNWKNNYAYIVDNINDNINNEKCITIEDYLNNEELINDVKNKKCFLVCNNGHILKQYKSDIRKSHFQHKNIGDLDENKMSDWHSLWQAEFPPHMNEIKYFHKDMNKKFRIADTLIDNDSIVEFQHSDIPKSEIDNRKQDYSLVNKKINWVIDANDSIEIYKLSNERIYIEFKNDFWKFNNYKSYDSIFLNINHKEYGDIVFKINPNDVKSFMIDVCEYKTREEFIHSIKNNLDIWKEDNPKQCNFFYDQYGAGNGKTYSIWQNICDKYNEKTTHIILTKQHSAKDVIYKEFKDQKKKGVLSVLEDIQELNSKDTNLKQYIIKYKNNKGNDCLCIIGTIDSFLWRIGKPNRGDIDLFKGLINSIVDGYVNVEKNGGIKYAEKTQLNKNTLITIDEGQDLPENYIKAVFQIMRETYIDVCLIGDKLQSISHLKNAFTYISDLNEETYNNNYIKIIKSVPKNICRRFHHPKLMEMVNKIIPFEDNPYNLPKIQGICDGKSCDYIDYHNSQEEPYVFFEVHNKYIDNDEILHDIQKIKNYMDIEIKNNNYTPEDFLFIFPFVSNNPFANQLEIELQTYWLEKFHDSNYINNVLMKHDYWKDNYNIDKFSDYVYFHKSEEGKSINLKLSEYSTRLVSIHSSKGDGRNVVFTIGLTESALFTYSYCKNLIYYSLLHVAITRQKKKLYVSLVCGDNLWDVFNNVSKIKSDNSIKKEIHINKNIKLDNIIKNVKEEDYLMLYEKLNIYQYESTIPESSNKNLIDWTHHCIRYSTILNTLLYEIINNMDKFNGQYRKCQLVVILNKISRKPIKVIKESKKNEYYSTINKKGKNWEPDTIPILQLSKLGKDYEIYSNEIKNIMENIQKKIDKFINVSDNSILSMNPLESIILNYMIDLYNNGHYSKITLMDIYNIYNDYSIQNNDIKSSRNTQHYESISNIQNIFIKLKEDIKCKYLDEDEELKWNIDHPIGYQGCNENFDIFNIFKLIANSNKYVFNIILKPQYNKLNFNEIMLESILNTYFLMNTKKDTENYKRYNNKTIINCFITLDLESPLFICWDNILEYNDIILNLIKNSMYKHYELSHKSLFSFMEYCLKENIYGLKTEHIYNKISEYEKLPDYIEKSIYDMKTEHKKSQNKKQWFQDNVNEYKIMERLENKLMESIDEYLGLNIIDDDY
tara:strand:- start:4376 stop:7897 length:3522 start_codon:yes stop_codon:yes gene_type:complete